MELPVPSDILDLLRNSAVTAQILLRPVALADSGVFVWGVFSICIITITALLNVYVAV